jgi:hypothetical protein
MSDPNSNTNNVKSSKENTSQGQKSNPTPHKQDRVVINFGAATVGGKGTGTRLIKIPLIALIIFEQVLCRQSLLRLLENLISVNFTLINRDLRLTKYLKV